MIKGRYHQKCPVELNYLPWGGMIDSQQWPWTVLPHRQNVFDEVLLLETKPMYIQSIRICKAW